ncbi:MAG: hypothetical protein OXF06_14360 [Bacteroidetes bacterium]|nr:hypothetical protein [Bacteroidota bacterium]
MSYLAWLSSKRTKDPNEVSSFYEASLQRTRARLNTQRKLLTVMWTIWKNDVDYDPDQLYRIPVFPVNAQTT